MAQSRSLLVRSIALMGIAAGGANADPVGLVSEDATDGLAQSLGLRVCRVYVSFDSAADTLLSLGFSDISTDDPAGFYQHWGGDDGAPSSGYCSVLPELCLDSYVTIGLDDASGGDTTMVDPDWDSNAFNNAGQTAGGWYNSSPQNGQGTPDGQWRVLVAQLTVHSAYNVAGAAMVYYNDGVEGFAGSFDCFGSPPGAPEGGARGQPESEGVQSPGAGGPAAPLGGASLWYVDAAGQNNGTTWTDAFNELQSALNAAHPGDQIWVTAGVYRPDFDLKTSQHTGDRHASFIFKDQLAIYGGFFGTPGTENDPDARDPDPGSNGTVLTGDLAGDDNPAQFPDPGQSFADNAYHVVTLSGTTDAVLDGFRITAGNAHDVPLPGVSSGGGLIGVGTVDPLLANCQFEFNQADCSGGAAVLAGGTVANCTFQRNHGLSGGALSAQGPMQVEDCAFIDNGAFFGAGLKATGLPLVVSKSLFQDNCLSEACDPAAGAVWAATSIDVVNCRFFGNYSGGFTSHACIEEQATLMNCLFADHPSTVKALTTANPCLNSSNPSGLTSCDLPDPSCATCTAEYILKPVNSVFSQNAHAIQSAGQIDLSGSILWANTSTQIVGGANGPCTVWYSDVQSGLTGTNCVDGVPALPSVINQDPLFESPATGDFRLQSGSPCIEAGDNTQVPVDVADLDGDGNQNPNQPTPLDLALNPRFVDEPTNPPNLDPGVPSPAIPNAIVDMGAYEYQVPCPWDVTHDGTVNASDLAQLLGTWGPSNCPPNPLADFNTDCVVNASDLAQLLGHWGSCE